MSDPRDQEHEVSTFAGKWRHAVEVHGARPFLTFEGPDGTSATWSYREFDAVVARARAFLRRHDVTQGSAVHLALANTPTFVAVWLAASTVGAWIVPSDPSAAPDELAQHARRTRPLLGFCAATRADQYRASAPPHAVVEVDETDTDLAFFGDDEGMGHPTVRPSDRAAVMFTSGTTGNPKGVEVTQANYAFAGAAMAKASSLQSHHRQLVVLPLFHANAQYYSFASAISVGGSVALMHRFSASRFLEQVARYEATHASLFASPIRMILRRTPATAEPVSLQHCWYAMNISADDHGQFSHLIGCQPRQLYGMTETIAAVLSDREQMPTVGSMGTVTPGTCVDLHRADGTPAPDGEVGQIVVSGKRGVSLFAGYLDDTVATEQSFDGEWFLTRDRARRDIFGRYYFEGRQSDILKVAGENVSTAEIEHALSAHPAVLEAVVVGVPHVIKDEVPVAFVVLASLEASPTPAELGLWCEQHLAKSKRPETIHIVDALPRTSVGKIRKFALRTPAT